MEKKVTVISGLWADDRNNKVKIRFPDNHRSLKGEFTLGINLFILQEVFCTVFEAGNFRIQTDGTYLKVCYKNRSLFEQAMVQQYFYLKNIYTVDLRYKEQNLELFINGARLAEAKLEDSLEIEDTGNVFIGGSQGCFVRWFRIYQEALENEEIRKRILGSELEAQNAVEFREKPCICCDFTKRNDKLNQNVEFSAGSRIVEICECLHMEPKGSVFFQPDITLFQEGDCSIQFTIWLESLCMKEECLFCTGGAEAFALMLRAGEKKERYLDIQIGERIWRGKQPMTAGAWTDIFLVKAGSGLTACINDTKDADIVINEALPAGYTKNKTGWYFGNGKNSFGGYVAGINVLDRALNTEDRTQIMQKRVSRFSGSVLLSYRFQKAETENKLDGEMFFNKNASLSALVNALGEADGNEPELMLFEDETRKFPEAEREKFEVCYEFLVQTWKHSYGVIIDQKPDSLTDAQKCELLPYLDKIAEIYNREISAGTGAAACFAVENGESQNDDWEVVFPALILIGLLTSAISTMAAIYLSALPAYWIAAFGIPFGLQAAFAFMAAGLAVALVSAIVWGIVSQTKSTVRPSEEESSQPESGDPSQPAPSNSLIFSRVSFISDAGNPSRSGVYIKRTEMEPAVKEYRVLDCTAAAPGPVCFLRKKIQRNVLLKIFFKNSNSKETYTIYPQICIDNQKIAVSQMEKEFDTGESCVEFSVPKEALPRKTVVSITINFNRKKQNGVIMPVNDAANLTAYILENQPVYPYDISDAQKAPSEAEFKAYGVFLNDFGEKMTVKDMEKRFCSTVCIAKESNSQRVSALESRLEFIPSDIRRMLAQKEGKRECTCNSLDISILFVLVCALAGIRLRVIRIASMIASYSAGEDDLKAFPLYFREGFWKEKGLPFTEYYMQEFWDPETKSYIVCDVFSGNAADTELPFTGESQTFLFPQEDCYQAKMIASGTPAGITDCYTEYVMVDKLTERKKSFPDCGWTAPVIYDKEKKKFILSGNEPMLDPLLQEEYLVYKRQEIMGNRLFGEILLELVNELNQRPKENETNIKEKIKDLQEIIINGRIVTALPMIKSALRERIGQLEQEIAGNASVEQILQTVNLVVTGFRNLPSNLANSSNRWERNADQYSPKYWYYYADGLVWAYEGGIFDSGVAYEVFCESYASGPMHSDEPESQGIYLTDPDDLAVLNYILRQKKEFHGIRVYSHNLWREEIYRKIYLVSAITNTYVYHSFYNQEYRGKLKITMEKENRGRIQIS